MADQDDVWLSGSGTDNDLSPGRNGGGTRNQKRRGGHDGVEVTGKHARRDGQKVGNRKDLDAAPVSSIRGRIGAEPVPALSVSTSEHASVSSLSQGGTIPSNDGLNVHYSESNAVREYVRSEIYPKKKTIFCDQEIIYGSALATKVIEYILYNKDGFYRRKKETTYAKRRTVEVAFWTRNQEIVRRALKEKVNNSLSRFKEKLESKCWC
jgi:hypothetical protein